MAKPYTVIANLEAKSDKASELNSFYLQTQNPKIRVTMAFDKGAIIPDVYDQPALHQ